MFQLRRFQRALQVAPAMPALACSATALSISTSRALHMRCCDLFHARARCPRSQKLLYVAMASCPGAYRLSIGRPAQLQCLGVAFNCEWLCAIRSLIGGPGAVISLSQLGSVVAAGDCVACGMPWSDEIPSVPATVETVMQVFASLA